MSLDNGQISHCTAAQGYDTQDGIKWGCVVEKRSAGNPVRNALQFRAGPASDRLGNRAEHATQDQHKVHGI